MREAAEGLAVFETYYPAAWLISIVASILVVGLHYEMLTWLALWLEKLSARIRLLLALLCLIAVHIVEIHMFAIVYWLMSFSPGFGGIEHIESWFDYFYYSSVVYTTVGFGDLVPIGPYRIVTGIESLIGLVLITWSATFMFIHRTLFEKEV